MAGLKKLAVTAARLQQEPRAYPIPPHAPSRGNFDKIFKRPIAAGTETLGFDRNTINPEGGTYSWKDHTIRRRPYEDI